MGFPFQRPIFSSSSSSLLRSPSPSCPSSKPLSRSYLQSKISLFHPASTRFVSCKSADSKRGTRPEKTNKYRYIYGDIRSTVEITSRLCALLASNYPRMKTSPVLPFHSPSSPPQPRDPSPSLEEGIADSLLDIQPIIYYRYTPWSSFFTGIGVLVTLYIYIMIRWYVHLRRYIRRPGHYYGRPSRNTGSNWIRTLKHFGRE